MTRNSLMGKAFYDAKKEFSCLILILFTIHQCFYWLTITWVYILHFPEKIFLFEKAIRLKISVFWLDSFMIFGFLRPVTNDFFNKIFLLYKKMNISQHANVEGDEGNHIRKCSRSYLLFFHCYCCFQMCVILVS